MNFNVDHYEKLVVEHCQDIQHKSERQRLLACLPHHAVARRAAGRLGVLLVTLGTRLEKLDRHREAVAYDLGR
jgi:hypothetical protein